MSHTIKQTQDLREAVRGVIGADGPLILLPGGRRGVHDSAKPAAAAEAEKAEPTAEQLEYLALLSQIEQEVARQNAVLQRVAERFKGLPVALEATLMVQGRVSREADDGEVYVKLDDVLGFLRDYRL